MIWLTISIIALGLGVLSSTLLEQYDSWKSRLHGFVIGFIGLLLFAEIMPHSYTHIGWTCTAWFAIGFLLIAGIDYISSHKNHDNRTSLTCFHALVDGVALGTGRWYHAGSAIVAHRLPKVLPLRGKRTTVWVNGYFAVMTLIAWIFFSS